MYNNLVKLGYTQKSHQFEKNSWLCPCRTPNYTANEGLFYYKYKKRNITQKTSIAKE